MKPGTLIDNPLELAEPRPPLMKRMCSRCQMVLGWVVCVAERGGEVTHGMCEACALALLEELDEMPAPESAADLARWREHRAAMALACEYTLDVGGAGPAPRAATPRASCGAVNDNASEAPARSGVLSFCAPGVRPARSSAYGAGETGRADGGRKPFFV